jgi:hypothetical protein
MTMKITKNILKLALMTLRLQPGVSRPAAMAAAASWSALSLRLALLLLLLLVPTAAYSQGARFDDVAWKFTSGGNWPAGNATITVCTATATGIPCAPLASIYTDPSLAPQFLITGNGSSFKSDFMGNYGFYAAASTTYVITITGPGLTGYSKVWVAPIVSGGAATFSSITSSAANPAATGCLRLASADSQCWRNNANTADLCWSKNASDALLWPGALSISGQFISTLATGTAPFSIASTTVVPNLNAQLHGGLTAPASAIVGISDTQALTNKTLTGASNGNSVNLLNAQANAGAITGTGSPVNIYTYTIPANTVANLKGIRLTVSVNHSTGSASVAYALTLNGQTVWTNSNSLTGFGSAQFTILNTGATSGTFSRIGQLFGSGGDSWTDPIPSLSWSSNQALSLTFNVANTDQVTPIQWVVELIQ